MMESTATARRMETSLIRWSLFLSRDLSPPDLSPLWPTASPLVSLSLTLANMGVNPITTAPIPTAGRALAPASHVRLVLMSSYSPYFFSLSSLPVSFFQTLFLYVIKLQFCVYFFYQDYFLFLFLPASLSLCLSVLIPV